MDIFLTFIFFIDIQSTYIYLSRELKGREKNGTNKIFNLKQCEEIFCILHIAQDENIILNVLFIYNIKKYILFFCWQIIFFYVRVFKF